MPELFMAKIFSSSYTQCKIFDVTWKTFLGFMEKTCNFACCSTGLVGSFICNVEEIAYVLTIAVLNELNDLCLSTKNMRKSKTMIE